MANPLQARSYSFKVLFWHCEDQLTSVSPGNLFTAEKCKQGVMSVDVQFHEGPWHPSDRRGGAGGCSR